MTDVVSLRGRRVTALAAIVMLLSAAAGVQAARDRWFARPAVTAPLLYLHSGNAVRRLAGAYQPLFADIYWIRTVQHYGGNRLGRTTGRRYELLYPLLDITTSLDPYFTVAYRFGAFFLADAYPSGAGRPDLAVALLQKGLRAEPEKWEYAQDIGFVYYWSMADYARAGEWYLRASKMPGAPNWMALVAASMVSGVDRQSARFLWTQILATAEVEWMRQSARLQLMKFDTMDILDAVNARLRPFLANVRERPVTWERLVRAGVVPGVPTDATGVPLLLDPESGKVTVATASSLYPLSVGPPPDKARGNR